MAAKKEKEEAAEAAPTEKPLAADPASAIETGKAHLTRGEYQQARELFQKALEHAEKQQDPLGIASSIEGLGIVAVIQGNYSVALAHYARALASFEALGETTRQMDVLQQLALLHQLRGDTALMRAYYQKAATLGEPGL